MQLGDTSGKWSKKEWTSATEVEPRIVLEVKRPSEQRGEDSGVGLREKESFVGPKESCERTCAACKAIEKLPD